MSLDLEKHVDDVSDVLKEAVAKTRKTGEASSELVVPRQVESTVFSVSMDTILSLLRAAGQPIPEEGMFASAEYVMADNTLTLKFVQEKSPEE